MKRMQSQKADTAHLVRKRICERNERRLTNANDIEVGFIGGNCGLLGTTAGKATLACLDEGTITLLRL